MQVLVLPLPVSVQRWITKPVSFAELSTQFRVTVLILVFPPLVPDQELRTGRSTGVTYWEGAVAGSGSAGGSPVAVEGYAELTGYAGGMGGLF
jgi:hypothetical protein